MAPRDDRVRSENEPGRFQSADSYQQESEQARTKTFTGSNGHQPSRPDPINGRGPGRIQSSTKFFTSSLVARKSAQTYQPTGRPRGRPTNKSRISENGLPLAGLPSTSRHQAVTRSNGAETDRYINKNNEDEEQTGNSRSSKNDRTKDSRDAQIPQGQVGRSNPKEDLFKYQRFDTSMTADGLEAIGECCPINDEPPKSRLKRTSEINIECLPQDCSADNPRNRSISIASQYLPPPELKSSSSRPSAPAVRGEYHHARPATANWKAETAKPTSTLAAPTTGGRTPPQSYLYSGQKRGRNLDSTCDRCGKPGNQRDNLVCCSEYDAPYHNLCRQPAKAILNNKDWKCQRCCARSEQQSSSSTPKGQSSHSTASETSASSVASAALIPLSTGPPFKPDESKLGGTGPFCTDNARPENTHSYSDGDRPRIKRLRGDMSIQHQWLAEDPVLGRAYDDLEYEELARSKIFHGSQTFAVVIGSHSRSTSASADSKPSDHHQLHQSFEPSATAKIPQQAPEWTTKRITDRSLPPVPKSRSEDGSSKQTCLPSEIKDSQEMDYETIDTQMGLDSVDSHSPMQGRNMHTYRTGEIPSNNLGTWGRDIPGPFVRYEESLSHEKSRVLSENISPHYSPSVGDRVSPPYSPPPPNVDMPYGNPGNNFTYAALPQTALKEPENNDDGFFCVMCNFHTPNNKPYKDNICGACSPSGPPRRNPRAIQESPPPMSQRTVLRIRHLSNSKHFRKKSRKHHNRSFVPALPTRSQSHETPKNSTSEELCSVPPVGTFQSVARVIEKDQFKPGVLEPVPRPKPRALSVVRKDNDEPIKNAWELDSMLYGNPDLGQNSAAVSANGGSRKPVKSNNSTGPARKYPIALNHCDSPPRMANTAEWSISRSGDVLPKRIPRRPAVKNASGSIKFTDSEDSDDPVNDSARIQMLEKRLEEQKSCTKNQRNEARRLQEKLADVTRQNKIVQEQLDAVRDQVRRIRKSNPVQMDQNNDTKSYDNAVKLTTGKPTTVPLKLKDIYKDIDFTASSPWPCPPELPEPDPSTFRKPGWRKQKAPEYDTQRMMKVHLHRQLTRVKGQPFKITPGPPAHQLFNSHPESRSNSWDDEHSEYSLGGNKTTIDEFLGFPENIVPAVKDGALGFRPGIINQRTRRLDRNVQHYKVRTPGALLDRI